MVFNQMYDALKKRFDDGDVKSPLDFKYILQLQFLLSTIGSWPHKGFGRRRLGAIVSMFNLFLIAFASTSCILSLIYIKLYMEQLTFFFFGHVLLCWFFAILYLVHAQIHTISGMFTIFVMFEMFIGLIFFIFMPWYNNYSRGLFSAHRPENTTFEHSVYFYLPEAVYTTVEGYWILFTINIYVSYVTTIGLCVFDLLVCLIVFQIWGHLRILKHSLLNLPLPAGNASMYSVEENYQIRRLLKENILHHNLITKFVDRCSDAFSEYLFLFYLIMQFITCILLLEVSSFTADSLAKYGPLTGGMHQQLIQVSVLFEMLNTKSEQLIDAVYATPWERMDAANRRTVLFFLQRIQTPVSLKAAKVVPVGVNTMSAVLKTTFSYYMMLKTLAGEREAS